MPTARINGFDMYFERHGEDGEPLVLVHGYTGDLTDWWHQVPEFLRTHRVLMMDHRGHGRSQAPTDRTAYSIDQMSRDVEAIVAETGFERYHLLGHSMGGAIVQEIALRSPGRLMSLTLEDTAQQFNFQRDERMRAIREAMRKVAEEEGMAALAAMPSQYPRAPHMPEERERETRERLSRMSVDAYVGAWQGLREWEGTEDRAQAISAPTLVICGDRDTALVPTSEWLAANIAGATLEWIPEAQHSPQFERPELFNAVLRRHLDRHAGSAAK
jgi:pimeloyl-ACP methyl ester carboxylesterase